jgi:hypothetical protein
MTSTAPEAPDPVGRSVDERGSARAAAATRLRAAGWQVVEQPAPEQLPAPLGRFHPDLVAHRRGEWGEEHVAAMVRGVRPPDSPDPGPDELAALAGQLLDLPGWELEVVWTGADEPPVSAAHTAERARRAQGLVATDPEAALLLAWAAVEGALAAQAEREGVTHRRGGALLAELYSRGLLEESTFDLLRDAQRRREAIAHGRSAQVQPDLVRWLAQLALTPPVAA